MMNHFESTSCEFEITCPKQETEFEVQAHLFTRLRSQGFKVRGEVRWRNPKTRRCCRFDLVLFRGDKAFHAIEVKARPVKHKNGAEKTRQGVRYRQFGVPVTFVYGFDDAAEFSLKAEAWER